MSVTREEVRHIAALARLELAPSEVEEMTEQLNRILEYVDLLKEADTEGVEPMTRITSGDPVYREDEAVPGLNAAEALLNAPSANEGYFTVPKVLGGRQP